MGWWDGGMVGSGGGGNCTEYCNAMDAKKVAVKKLLDEKKLVEG